jgi:imidazolonepropionase
MVPILSSSPDRWLVVAGRVVTCDGERCSDGNPLGALDQAALLIEGGAIAALGPVAQLEQACPDALRLDHGDAVVTPGLVDAHTHAAWIGSRGCEYAMRMRGASYEQIAQAGGGIVASMRAVRAADLDELSAALVRRLGRMATVGATTVEVKSGYGLDEASERRQLEAVARAARHPSLPELVPTFLGLHAVAPELHGDRDAHARACLGWLEGVARDGLARFADAYVDRNAFSVEQARPVLERARQLGLGVRLHVGQFADVGGAQLAAELGAASADHLEHVSEEGALALGRAGTCAVLLPVASYTLGQAPPPVERLRRAGVPLVVASDSNPGTAPTESLPLALSLAVRSYGLSVAEALLGATREAARSLGLDRGRLRIGAAADLVVWDLPHEDDLMQPWGLSRARLVLRAGRIIHQDPG